MEKLILSSLIIISLTQQSPSQVSQPIELLGSDNASEREFAQQKLRELGPSVLTPLIKLMGSQDPELALRAQAVARLIESDTARQRREQLVQACQAELDSDQRLANSKLIEQLKRSGEKEAESLISELRKLSSTNTGHPPTSSSSRPDLIPALAIALDSESSEVRIQAICGLAYMNHHKALPILATCVKHEDPAVRNFACMGLEWVARKPECRAEAIAALNAPLHSKIEANEDVRIHAASSLVQLGEKQDKMIFVTAVRQGKGKNVDLAVLALAKLDQKDTIELIVKRMSNASEEERHFCAIALSSLTGQTLGTDYSKWNTWLSKNRSHLPEQLGN